jgi:hypothetical protein
MSRMPKSKNKDYLEKNWDNLIKKYEGKYILIYDGGFVGAFDTYTNAASEGIERFGIKRRFYVAHMVEEEALNFVIGA